MKQLKASFLLAAAMAAVSASATNGIMRLTLPGNNHYYGYGYGDRLTADGGAAIIGGGDMMMSEGVYHWSAVAGIQETYQIITGSPSPGYGHAMLYAMSEDASKAVVDQYFGGYSHYYVDFTTGAAQPISLPGISSAYSQALSSNGLFAGGSYSYGSRSFGFIWSPTGAPTTNIGAGYNNASVTYVADDGSWALGSGFTGSTSLAFLWKRSDGSETTFNSVAGLSASLNTSKRFTANGGRTVIIEANPGGSSTHYKWNPLTGEYVHLDLSAYGAYAYPTGVSADGSAVLMIDQNNRIHRWTASGWNHDLTANLSGVISAGSNSSYTYDYENQRATNMSNDGNVVVGTFYDGSKTRVFRWTASSGATNLFASHTNWDGGYNPIVSSNGLVVYGTIYDGSNSNVFRWTAATGTQTVTQWLQSVGVDVTPYADWTFQLASSTSADGSMLLGTARRPDYTYFPFIATARGVADVAAWMSSVNEQHRIYAAGVTLAGLPLEGAHHRPMLSYDRMGKESQAWATGDFGSSSRTRDVHVTTGEAGINWNLGKSFLFGVAAGHGEQNADLAFDGSSTTKGDYALAELDFRPEGTQWTVSLLGMIGSWEAKVNRGYEVGGANSYSFGVTDLVTRTARLRVDAPALATFGGFGFAPYASYSVTQTAVDPYAETGGIFPANFDSQEHDATEARVGITASKDVSAATKLLLTVEAIHRFDGVGPALSGQDVTGGVSFSLPGTAPRADSVRFGFDVDHKLSEDTLLNLSAHVSTVGEEHDVSAAISIRRAF